MGKINIKKTMHWQPESAHHANSSTVPHDECLASVAVVERAAAGATAHAIMALMSFDGV